MREEVIVEEVEEVEEVSQEEINKVLLKKRHFSYDLIISNLLIEEPFLSTVSQYIKKVETDQIPTAAVGFDFRRHLYVMYYNPNFFALLTEEQIKAVVKHEIFHIIYGHLIERKVQNEKEMMFWNIATDLAINSHLQDELPLKMPGVEKGGDFYIPERGKFAAIPANRTAEQYFEVVMNDPERFCGQGQTVDSHGTWVGQESPFGDGEGGGQRQGAGGGKQGGGQGDGLSDAEKEIMKRAAEDLKKKAAEHCKRVQNWGTIPQAIQADIEKSLEHTIPWESLLRNFVVNTFKSHRKRTMRRINRKAPYIFPGTKKNKLPKLAVSVDQSGSVDSELLNLFFGEMKSLTRLVEITVIPFDSTVDEDGIFVWQKGRDVEAKRTRCGGTNFDAPTEWVNKERFDAHIIMTDMYAPKPIASKCKRMWVTDRNGLENTYFETDEIILAVERKNER